MITKKVYNPVTKKHYKITKETTKSKQFKNKIKGLWNIKK